jgi:hypothetical protein
MREDDLRRGLVLVLRLLLVRPCLYSELDILFVEDTDDASGDLVVNYGLVVFADDVNPEFFGNKKPQ